MISTKQRSVEKRPDGELKNVVLRDLPFFPTIETFARFPRGHDECGNHGMNKPVSLTQRIRPSRDASENRAHKKTHDPFYDPLIPVSDENSLGMIEG